MVNKDFFQALKDLEEQKGINSQYFIDSLEAALTSAYKKNFGEPFTRKETASTQASLVKVLLAVGFQVKLRLQGLTNWNSDSFPTYLKHFTIAVF